MPSSRIPYPVFAMAVWSYTSSSVTRATQSLVNNSALVTKVYLPPSLRRLRRSFGGSQTSLFRSSCPRCSSHLPRRSDVSDRHAAVAARRGRDRDGHRAVASNLERKGLSLENLLHCACARTV